MLLLLQLQMAKSAFDLLALQDLVKVECPLVCITMGKLMRSKELAEQSEWWAPAMSDLW